MYENDNAQHVLIPQRPNRPIANDFQYNTYDRIKTTIYDGAYQRVRDEGLGFGQ